MELDRGWERRKTQHQVSCGLLNTFCTQLFITPDPSFSHQFQNTFSNISLQKLWKGGSSSSRLGGSNKFTSSLLFSTSSRPSSGPLFSVLPPPSSTLHSHSSSSWGKTSWKINGYKAISRAIFFFKCKKGMVKLGMNSFKGLLELELEQCRLGT